ncbi:MAG TPA: SIS domain-containing protein [Gammaproteobacteria bacterium]|nr:SIS domain-containing protein [Gammaproteobacteria bacterium]
MVLDVQAAIAAHRQAIDALAGQADDLEQAAAMLQQTFHRGGTVFACGNGGSAADAQHFAAELTGRYQTDRPGYPAIALTTDSSALTSIGNDYGFEHVFARQLQALSRAGDLLIAISTSGNSANVQCAVEYARANGIYTIGLLGRDGGALAGQVDLALTIDVDATARIQEAHIVILHLLCEAFEPSP